MQQNLLEAFKAKGWSLATVAAKASVSEAKLARCKLGEREFLRVCHVAECEAGIDLDELEGGE